MNNVFTSCNVLKRSWGAVFDQQVLHPTGTGISKLMSVAFHQLLRTFLCMHVEVCFIFLDISGFSHFVLGFSRLSGLS